MTQESYIETSGPNGAIGFVGPDAVEYYRVAALKSALRLLKVGIKPNRQLTATRALQLATAITKKPYKGAAKFDTASADLDIWLAAARASLPVIVTETENG